MDREKIYMLPTMQIGFIDNICKPIYQAFANLSENFQTLLDGCIDNRRHWKELEDESRFSSDEIEHEDNKDDDTDCISEKLNPDDVVTDYTNGEHNG
jgi:dual 3',5'-cyclic-AMP and -GMP phosphodiesterase 11